jgi:hypothetical protein
LELDEFQGSGFVAMAYVDTQAMRPALLPAFLGKSFHLMGFRIFTRYRTKAGQRLRGLYVLRSQVDKTFLSFTGNWLTHYNWNLAQFTISQSPESYQLNVTSRDQKGDLAVSFRWNEENPPLPAGSCFDSWSQARLYAGPMPYTFAYEPETGSIVRVEGVRSDWHPKPVVAVVTQNSFLEKGPIAGTEARLVSAFHVENIPYRWKSGIVEK